MLTSPTGFRLVAKSDHTTGSRNIKPEVVSKMQKMARYASFCFIMGPFKGEGPVFARLSPVWPPWRAPRRSLTLACPAIFGLGLVLRLGQYGRTSLLQLGFLFQVLTRSSAGAEEPRDEFCQS